MGERRSARISRRLQAGSVDLVLDLPAEDLPWLALHPSAEWVGDQLRLGKRPMRWCYRPLVWPVWNHDHRRVVRFWSAPEGLDTAVIDALRSPQLDRLPMVEPSDDDADWRRAHRVQDEGPDVHLWRAEAAVMEIGDALEELG